MTEPEHRSRKLTLADISDLRAYERERQEFRAEVIALKKLRRVAVGPFVTILFENRQTIRFQIQEMARAEKIISDAGIEAELAAYNPLIPEPGELAVSLFVELTTEESLREWLPRLVDIERHLWVAAGQVRVRAQAEQAHADQLTRPDMTASVHYLHFHDPDGRLRAAMDAHPVTVGLDHPEYTHEVALGEDTVAGLRADLAEDPRPEG